MRVLYVSYATWKSVALANSFTVYEKLSDSTSAHVWIGTRDVAYRSDVVAANFTDYETNFPAGPDRVAVDDEDEALANIISLAVILDPRTSNGILFTALRDLILGQSAFQRIDNGSEMMNIDGRAIGTPANVWDGTGAGDTGASDWTVNGKGSETAGSNHSGTNGWDSGVSTATGDITRFSDAADSDIAGTQAELRFWMQPKAFPVGAVLRIEWQNLANTVVSNAINVANYVTNMDLDVWQQVAIPIADFNLTGDAARFRFRYRVQTGQHFWFDDIQLVPNGNGPFRFRVSAPDATVRYHISMLVIMLSGPGASWTPNKFCNISALPLGLNVRQRRLSDSEVLWKFNSKDNNDLFGRYHPQDDITYSDGTLQVGFMVKPGKASVILTDDEVLEIVVRDDLSGLTSARAFAHYGIEAIV